MKLYLALLLQKQSGNFTFQQHAISQLEEKGIANDMLRKTCHLIEGCSLFKCDLGAQLTNSVEFANASTIIEVKTCL